MPSLPIKATKGVYSYIVNWLPGLPMASVEVECTFEEIPDEKALTRFGTNIDMFATNAKECCLREIMEAAIIGQMYPGVESKRSPQRMGMSYGGGTDLLFKVIVNTVNGEDATNILHVDKLETTLRGDMWKQIHAE
jgi:hypothetical protein